MKKIIAIIALLFAVTSCGTSTNDTTTKTSNININNSDTVVDKKVEVTKKTEEVVNLTPEEEKIIEDLLNF